MIDLDHEIRHGIASTHIQVSLDDRRVYRVPRIEEETDVRVARILDSAQSARPGQEESGRHASVFKHRLNQYQEPCNRQCASGAREARLGNARVGRRGGAPE